MEYLYSACGLVLLFAGGDLLVRGAVSLALSMGVSALLAGLVIVGFGTSTPELLVSLRAALEGSPDIAVGNVVGSNIANVLLILGAAALIKPIACQPAAVYRDGAAVLAVSLAMVGLGWTGMVGRWTGAAMFAALLGYMAYCYGSETRGGDPAARMHEEEAELKEGHLPVWRSVLYALGGLLALMAGAELLVDGASSIARALGVPEAVIGLTLVALGTSLPELATSIAAAFRGKSDVAVGNVLGSNLFNILGILGVTAAVTPIPVSPQIVQYDLWIMLASAAVLLPLLLTGRRLSRAEGGLFLIAYAAYIVSLY